MRDTRSMVSVTDEPAREGDLIETSVRRCFVVGEGRPSSHLTVFCGLRRESVAFEECRRCPRFVSASPEAAPQPSMVCVQPGISGENERRRPSEVLVGAVMGLNAVCVRPELTLARVRSLMVAPGATIPVVDEERTLLGMVSSRELDTGDKPEFFGVAATAGDVMSVRDVKIAEHSTLLEAAAFMTSKRLRAAVVVDLHGRVLSVVDDIALLRWIAQHRDRGS